MNTRILIYAISLSLLFLSCGKNDDTKNSGGTNQDAQTLQVNGETREYVLYIPNSYDGTLAVPLLFNFHGYGGNASSFMNETNMQTLADSENFILVYPQGSLLNGNPHWNAGLDTPENKSDADDFGFVEAIIDELSANYTIDTERVYACGYSNGAFFSYALACYLSDKIAAIGSVSGTMLEETLTNCSPSHPTAMINIHGTSDGVVPYNGGEGLAAIESVINYWVDFNNTSSTAEINTIGNIEYFTYTNADNGSAIEHYKINNGDHIWFDIDYEGANTGELIWNFVSKYDINGLR